MEKFTRSEIIHEANDIAYVLLFEVIHVGIVDEVARRRGFSDNDIARIHKQFEKIATNIKSKAHNFADPRKRCNYPGCGEQATIECSMLGCTHKVCETHGNGGIEEAGEQFFPLCWGCDGKGWNNE